MYPSQLLLENGAVYLAVVRKESAVSVGRLEKEPDSGNGQTYNQKSRFGMAEWP